MKEYKKPLPRRVDPWVRTFWEKCKQHVLWIQHCKDCGVNVFPPKFLCPNCFSGNLSWVKASGRGKIYSFTVIYRDVPEAFDGDTPYVVAIIELEEGVRLISNIIDCNHKDLTCDIPVEVVFDDVTGDFSLPKFRLIA